MSNRMSNTTISSTKASNKKVTFFDFKGLMAPVFTCFKDDVCCTLDVRNVDRYAQWLKSEHINGILVNSVTGEGPALGLKERKLNAEAWWKAALNHELILMVQIGGAPLPDVLELAHHAEQMGVHAVLCLPELFYKPTNIEQLVGYCKIVANKCNTRPFFYYHIPTFTEVYFDMNEFCARAEEEIPNFFGIQYSSTDLDIGSRCLHQGRVVLLGASTLMASGLLLGFESALMTVLNIRPDLGHEILIAMKTDKLSVAKEKQTQLNQLTRAHTSSMSKEGYVAAMKHWFNNEMTNNRDVGFTAGPSRRFF